MMLNQAVKKIVFYLITFLLLGITFQISFILFSNISRTQSVRHKLTNTVYPGTKINPSIESFLAYFSSEETLSIGNDFKNYLKKTSQKKLNDENINIIIRKNNVKIKRFLKETFNIHFSDILDFFISDKRDKIKLSWLSYPFSAFIVILIFTIFNFIEDLKLKKIEKENHFIKEQNKIDQNFLTEKDHAKNVKEALNMSQDNIEQIDLKIIRLNVLKGFQENESLNEVIEDLDILRKEFELKEKKAMKEKTYLLKNYVTLPDLKLDHAIAKKNKILKDIDLFKNCPEFTGRILDRLDEHIEKLRVNEGHKKELDTIKQLKKNNYKSEDIF